MTEALSSNLDQWSKLIQRTDVPGYLYEYHDLRDLEIHTFGLILLIEVHLESIRGLIDCVVSTFHTDSLVSHFDSSIQLAIPLAWQKK